ncbi:DUF664 domain-containing protein [Nocardia cyriacigeorgica]|uniref:mycothiol transferase n=1 Tax=Nocardia cyriacigeorgica TaxID=135487 RepID=UPI003CC7CBF4
MGGAAEECAARRDDAEHEARQAHHLEQMGELDCHHLIAETAQHAGHADILRESLDGQTA